MTTPELLRQYIAADLVARAEAANIEIMDEWDFPYDPAIDEDDEEDPEYSSPYCEDAPCCGCCGTNIYGVYQGDDGPSEDWFDGYNDEFEYGM